MQQNEFALHKTTVSCFLAPSQIATPRIQTRYIIIIIIIIVLTLCSGCYFSCQCNNPTIESDNPQSGESSAPSRSRGGNPQSGESEPDIPSTWGRGNQDQGSNRGLPNCGNTCYMNSALQPLFTLYGSLIQSKASGAAADSLEVKLANLCKKVTTPVGGQEKNGTGEEKEIKSLYRGIAKSKNEGKITWYQAIKTQEDASEVLEAFFAFLNIPQFKVKRWLKKDSDLNPTRIKEFPSDPTYTLKLSIDEGIESMQDAIDQCVREEPVTDYKWDGDDSSMPSTRYTKYQGLNELHNGIMAISLIRHKNHSTKIDNKVNNPLEIKIRKEQKVDLAADKTYLLIGFIHHSGSTIQSGHYIAYIKEGTKWICYDDSSVSEVPDAAAEEAAKEAYVFFYQSK